MSIRKKLMRAGFAFLILAMIIEVVNIANNQIQNRQASIMQEKASTINSTIDLNSDERNRLQEELDAETRRIQAEQQELHNTNQQLRQELRDLQK